MNSEIKDGMFTSTQVSTLLGMNVQTLREWQRKKYLPLSDTGGWQRYSIADILALSTMDYVLDTGLTHEMAATIAAFSRPVLIAFMASKDEGAPAFRLLISVKPNEDAAFELFHNDTELLEIFENQAGSSQQFTTQIIIDFTEIYHATFSSLKENTVHDGPRMFWNTEGSTEQ